LPLLLPLLLRHPSPCHHHLLLLLLLLVGTSRLGLLCELASPRAAAAAAQTAALE
jgi:hypothetical protein